MNINNTRPINNQSSNPSGSQSGNILYAAVILVGGILFASGLFFIESQHHDEHGSGHAHHGEHAEEEIAKGPRGGRLLQQDDFALEMKIYEKGVPPEFHIYSYYHGKMLSPDDVSLNVTLKRLDGQIDDFQFQPQNDYLRGDGEVTEPHSFDVVVTASFKGKQYTWQYENYEGRVKILDAMAEGSGIETAKAGPRKIKEILNLTGRIQVDPNRLSHVRARFPGVVIKVQTELGAQVRKGDALAQIQSNESLQNYMINAPISGVIVARDVQVAEATSDKPLFTIANLAKVWVELDVFDKDLSRVQEGQSVQVETLSGESASGKIAWLSPMAAHASQSIQARVVLDNKRMRGSKASRLFRPGQFVRGRIIVAEHSVPLAVRQSGIQEFRDFQVVFARFAETYEVRMLELGRRDHDWVEVISGLKPATEYVTSNSYLIKADIEKSGASHDH